MFAMSIFTPSTLSIHHIKSERKPVGSGDHLVGSVKGPKNQEEERKATRTQETGGCFIKA